MARRYQQGFRKQKNSLPDNVRHFLVLCCHEDIAIM